MALFIALGVFMLGFLHTAAVPPEAPVCQRFSSPEMVCHAPGFFPRGVLISWMKDEEDLIEDVELREMLPNQDGSFQKKSILEGSPEDLEKQEYSVFTHGSLKGAFDLVVPDPKSDVIPIPVKLVVGGVYTFINLVVAILFWTKKPEYVPSSSKAGEVQRGA